MKRRLNRIFLRLYSDFGPQHWWPADSSFEVIIGAILTQNTNWANVEKAIFALKERKCLNPKGLLRLSSRRLGNLIKSSGYYNIKAERIKNFLRFFFRFYSADIRRMGSQDLAALRSQLLAVKGVGPETADSILLYALNKPVFVIDAYTKRIFSRHRILAENATYGQAQDIFMGNLKNDAKLFNEYHALLVKLGKDYCRKQNPKCEICPLNGQ
ncbi:MAG: endonuclease III domain-containing protein [Candidatus Omnitrophica bacterium]|nr:endonuclease III domain-containing protein [Candidatus Omnitrophota bacterium]MDD5691197.1 endonuclease III domain-containing protein [Candidatus Omnitrophota bacterium]